MAHSIQITFDAADPRSLADFWRDALGYERQPPPPGFDSWETWAVAQGIPPEEWNNADALVDPDGDGPRLHFQRVPEAKTSKSRVHLDVRATNPSDSDADRRISVDTKVARLTEIGATRVADFDEVGISVWTVMLDPEGNEFCVH